MNNATAEQVIDTVTVCQSNAKLPNFANPSCKQEKLNSVNTHKSHLWIKGTFFLEDISDQDKPVGLFIMGKSSSSVFVNGHFIGSNGSPASNKLNEIAGKMDTVFYLPQSILKNGSNEFVAELSAHHSILKLKNPIHTIFIADYSDPSLIHLKRYWKTLMPFGLFLVGALFMGLIAFRSTNKLPAVLLPVMSILASSQLLIETSRGFLAYEYWLHDIRLILLLLFSIVFGYCLLAYITWHHSRSHRIKLFSIAVIASLSIVIFTPGYDSKTTFCLLSLTVISLLANLFLTKQKSYFLTITLIAFMAIILFKPSQFLDFYFYYFLAGLIAVLFIHQAKEFTNEKEKLANEKLRSAKLQIVIDKIEEDKQASIEIRSAGKIQIVKFDEILFFKSVGDYIEINTKNNNSILHNSTLSKIEKEMPTHFLRVHRSYIANSNHIKSLKRHSSGTGELCLSNDSVIPVSRRIMPNVNQALKIRD